jgi:hypothetical protein
MAGGGGGSHAHKLHLDELLWAHVNAAKVAPVHTTCPACQHRPNISLWTVGAAKGPLAAANRELLQQVFPRNGVSDSDAQRTQSTVLAPAAAAVVRQTDTTQALCLN